MGGRDSLGGHVQPAKGTMAAPPPIRGGGKRSSRPHGLAVLFARAVCHDIILHQRYCVVMTLIFVGLIAGYVVVGLMMFVKKGDDGEQS